MRILGAINGCPQDLIRNYYIRMELLVAESLNDKISQYKTEWWEYMQREWVQLNFQEAPLTISQGGWEVWETP